MTVIINSGQLKHPIIFERKIKESDGAGSWIETWEGFAGDRVRIVPVNAAERIRGMKEEVEITHVLEGRHRNDIDEAMRIIYGKRIFEINSIIDVEEANVKNQYLCKEISGNNKG